MKIKRIYENNNFIKNKFEKYRLKQKKFHELENETNAFQYQFESLLKDYFILHPELDEQGNNIDDDIIIKGFKVIDRTDNYFSGYKLDDVDYLQLIYWKNYRYYEKEYENTDSAWFKEEDFDDFLRFMDDPETYKNANKYNI